MAGAATPPSRVASLVEPMDFPGMGRGCGCVRDVRAGEELMVVHVSESFREEEARGYAPLAPFASRLSVLDACALHVLLERAKGEASARWAHIQSLPKAYDIPVFWADAQLEELKGSAWHELTMRYKAEMTTDWAALNQIVVSSTDPKFLERHKITLSQYMWAYATFKSRAAEVTMNGKKAKLMAHRFDMFNHSDEILPGSSHDFDDARQSLVVKATRNYKKNEQAFISYGTAGNGSLLLGGGFVMEKNRFDSVEVPLTVLCDARRLPLLLTCAPEAPTEPHVLPTFEFLQVPKESELSDGQCAPFITKHLLTFEKPLPTSLLAYIRLERMSDADLNAFEKKLKAKRRSDIRAALSSDDSLHSIQELLSVGALRDVLQAMLGEYATTLADDLRTLATGSEHMAVAATATRDGVAGGEPDGTGGNGEGSGSGRGDASGGDGGGDGGGGDDVGDCGGGDDGGDGGGGDDGGDSAQRASQSESGASDEAVKAVDAARRRMATILRSSEKTILHKALRHLDWRICFQIKSLLNSMAVQRRFFRVEGERAWLNQLIRRQATIDERQERCERAIERLHAASLGSAHVNGAMHAQTVAAIFLILAGHDEHPLAGCAAFIPAASPLIGDQNNSHIVPVLKPSILKRDKKQTARGALAYLAFWEEKMTLWNAYLLGQALASHWGVAKGMNIEAASSIQREAEQIPKEWACSVPTAPALSSIAAFAPLIELGAGTGLWASELRVRGVDIIAFSQKTVGDESRAPFVQEGGPEVLDGGKHDKRTLVLMWPDTEGVGDYGAKCLRRYKGGILVLVGEWHDRTYTGHGKSFSPEFQGLVHSHFTLVDEQRLPNWPLLFDTLRIWKRNRMVQLETPEHRQQSD